MSTGHDTQPVLRATNVATGYGDLRVVWDVSVDVYAGRLTVLLGRNGAGKTTTLRAISGLNKVSAGSVELEGTDITKTPVHQRVRKGMAYVQEGKRVFKSLTVEQNIVMGGYTRHMRRAALAREASRIYDLFPILGDKRHLPAGSMSGGQQQMLAIGQALMANPTLLLLDEPSGGLAPVIVNEVMERVGQLKQTGIGILLVEQAVEASLKVADHVAVLDMGKVVLNSAAADVDDISLLQDAYFGRTAGTATG